MPDGSQGFGRDVDGNIDEGCRYLTGDAPGVDYCALPLLPGSSYCPEHHALCHMPPGTQREDRQRREIEALAEIVGGRRGREAPQPPRRVFGRLLRVERRFSRPYRS